VDPARIPGPKAEIVYDDFAKLDLRVGKILTAEKVKKSDKLLKFTVDLGFEQRTILSGIAQHFSPEEMIGRQVTVVANLAPRKMMGTESHGMILMAEVPGGKLHLINPETGIEPGSTIS
jgi:methionyl-tRNA synthetase